MLDNKHETGGCMRLSEFQAKEVINLCDCKRLGYVSDLHIDECNGCITAIILPGESKFCGLFGNQTEIVIPFECIKKVGPDLIFVEICEEKFQKSCKE